MSCTVPALFLWGTCNIWMKPAFCFPLAPDVRNQRACSSRVSVSHLEARERVQPLDLTDPVAVQVQLPEIDQLGQALDLNQLILTQPQLLKLQTLLQALKLADVLRMENVSSELGEAGC